MRIKVVEEMLKKEAKFGSMNLGKVGNVGKQERIHEQFSSLTHANYKY